MKILHENKKALFDYEVLEKFQAGLVLLGSEIKSIRLENVNLKGAYVGIFGGEAWLKNANISRYKYDSREEYNPLRERKLLLKKKEIEKLAMKLNTQGVTLVPLAIGIEGRYAKLIIALARGRKKHDKRQLIKERTTKREIQRAIRKRY